MKIASEVLIQQLRQDVDGHLKYIGTLGSLNDESLNWRESTDSWSVLECVEHLKRYNDFYLPEIGQRIRTANAPAVETFSSGWIGNYFAKSMLPKEKLNKMNTFKEMNPIRSQLRRDLLDVFQKQLQEQQQLLEAARKVDLSKVKTSISISNVLKLRLGDTFRVVINHQTRHFAQIGHIQKAMSVV